MWRDQCNGIDFVTAKRRRGGGHRASFLVLQIRELEIRVQHIALVTAVAFRASAALVTALL